jgi:2-keto-3-deoxy-L-fuconate dehydrogenase
VAVGDVSVDQERASGSGAPALYRLDVSDEDSVATCIRRVEEELGPIQVLVNSAGVTAIADTPSTSLADWERVIGVNLRGTFLTCKHVVPLMAERGGGAIVNVASHAGLVGMRQRAAYCASKGGVVALTKALALDHVRQGIRVNAVCPGTTDTPWMDRVARLAPDPEQARKEFAARQPMGRMGRPEEIAAAIEFLASGRASFITGTTLLVDGGWTAE